MLSSERHDMHVSAWVKHHARQFSSTPIAKGYKVQALHTYTDTHGNPTHWRIRLKHPATGDKWIRPMRRNDAGFDLKQTDYPNGTPLYRLHELAARPDEPVLNVEGETCTDALAKLDVLATTSGSADSAGKADLSPLAERRVMIWPDNDEAGQHYAADMKARLAALGCTVAVIDVDKLGLPVKGDVVDWLAAHPDATAADVWALPVVTAPESPASADAVADDTQGNVETDNEVIARLAALPAMQYDRMRKDEAKKLGVQVTTLDSKVKAARANDEEASAPFTEPEPWPDPIDPATLLTEIVVTIRRFIILEPHQADAAALWIAFTHCIDVVEVAPLAIINAPEKSCGKSQLLTVFGRMVARPLSAANSSAAFLFRAVELWTPTVLIDEADTFVRDNEELKGLVNAGHTRQNAFVGRVVGDNHEPKLFKVWGAKAMAGIALEKHLPDATMSRAVIFNMRRKLAGEKVQRIRDAESGLFDTLQSKLARFADDHADAVKYARPALPDSLNDRAQDNWEPLLAIAQCAGAEWLARATKAALLLSGATEATQSTANELLADIQQIFESKGVERISTADLIAALIEDDEAAWATYNRGKQLVPRQLARMLKGYGIQSKTMRIGYDNAKGYEKTHFQDAFNRYLSTSPQGGDLSVTSVTNTANPIKTGDASLRIDKSRYDNKTAPVTLEPASLLACDGVTDKTAFFGSLAETEKVRVTL